MRTATRDLALLWLIGLAVAVIACLTLTGCQTSTKQPDGTTVQDPPQVQLQKNLKFWRGELDVAKGVFDGMVAQGALTPERAAKYKTWLSTAQLALGLSATGVDNFTCLKDLSCTDEQMAVINQGIGEALVLILTVKGGR